MASELIRREQQKKEDTWAMEDLYQDEKSWEEDKRWIEKELDCFAGYQGHLGEGSRLFADMLTDYCRIQEKFEKLYVYANQKLHENTAEGKYQQLAGVAQNLETKLGSTTAFMMPEILDVKKEVLDDYLKEEPELLIYRKFLDDILIQKGHVLSQEKEELLAQAAELAEAPSNIYSMFQNADIRFEDIQDETGEKVRLTQGRYLSFLENQDRNVRKSAFESVYATYKNHENMLAAAYDANAKQAVFFARVRNYPSSLEAKLSGSHIPVHVYENLIETVHRGLPFMYRYMDVRKRALGLKELHMYDLHVSMVPGINMRVSFEEAKEMVLEGLEILGEEYGGLLQQAFSNRWIDVYENEGKRTGAYSWGAYGTHPYVLLNYQGNLNNVFTLAHEMGHALHSYYSDKEQPYIYAGYRIFVAEVASTCNEALLIYDLLEKTEEKKKRAYLINYFLDQFKNTLYRQTMFAEFEKLTHRMAEEGKTLNANTLCDTYYQLNSLYFGDRVEVDKEIAYEWARIPHFYTPFYVYQYATGFSAAIAISKKIRNREEGIVEKYKQFLSGGSSKDPIGLLKICGVDMTSPKPIEDALKVFEEYLIELGKLV